jgi:hypothetical protein
MNIWEEKNIIADDYQKDNFKIVNYDNDSNICILFCSSNGIYYPNTEAEYVRQIRQKDKYEWERTAGRNIIKKRVRKVIFIRDLYKQWYVTGINSRLCTIDLLVEFLKTETLSYDIITVGNSAGGYMALLLGILLNAKRIISIAGQCSLIPFIDRNPFLAKYKNVENRAKYYEIYELINQNENSEVFYSVSCKVPADVEQCELIRDGGGVFILNVNSQKHGKGIHKSYYPYLFLCNSIDFRRLRQKYKAKIIRPFQFYTTFSDLILNYISLPFEFCLRVFRYLIFYKNKR